MARGLPALLALAALAVATPAAAHQGPPFALFVDRPVGPYTLSVWGDPDVGTGVFYIIFEDAPPSLNPTVEVAVRPVTGRLPEAVHAARRQPLRDRVQYLAEVPFDRQERWHVVVRVRGPAGTAETATEVEVTPDGLGPLDLALYGAPFAAIAALWLRMFLRRPRARVTPPPGPAAGAGAP